MMRIKIGYAVFILFIMYSCNPAYRQNGKYEEGVFLIQNDSDSTIKGCINNFREPHFQCTVFFQGKFNVENPDSANLFFYDVDNFNKLSYGYLLFLNNDAVKIHTDSTIFYCQQNINLNDGVVLDKVENTHFICFGVITKNITISSNSYGIYNKIVLNTNDVICIDSTKNEMYHFRQDYKGEINYGWIEKGNVRIF